MRQKRTRTRTTRRKTAKTNKWRQPLLLMTGLLLFAVVCYHYRDGLAYYFGFKSDKTLIDKAREKRVSDIRNHQLLKRHSALLSGIDVSEYQGNIEWDSVRNLEGSYPVRFVFIRATAGNDRPDSKFVQNWAAAKKHNIIRGAYHYYRPNENSLEQAALFIKTVKLRKGDLPPVLDIEQLPKNQSFDSLKKGLQRWLNKVEAHYGVKPIIYSGEKYYTSFLKEEFAAYPFWIANYNFFVEEIKDGWLFWQFTEKATVNDIPGNVDVNLFNGTAKELRYLTVGN